MNTETQPLSDGFQRLYCDATVFDGFSALHQSASVASCRFIRRPLENPRAGIVSSQRDNSTIARRFNAGMLAHGHQSHRDG
jgi:hypothetical protein